MLPKLLKLTALVLGALLVSLHLRQMVAYSFNCKLDMRGKVQEDVSRPYWLSIKVHSVFNSRIKLFRKG